MPYVSEQLWSETSELMVIGNLLTVRMQSNFSIYHTVSFSLHWKTIDKQDDITNGYKELWAQALA